VRCSYEQLVSEHRVDPELVLVNLGFVKPSDDDEHRVPDHFLLYRSKACGITCDEYLDEHPDVRQHLEQKLAVENAFRVMGRAPPSPASSQMEGRLADCVRCFKVTRSNFQGHSSFHGHPGFHGHLNRKRQSVEGRVPNPANFECHMSGLEGHSEDRDPNLQGHFLASKLQGRSGDCAVFEESMKLCCHSEDKFEGHSSVVHGQTNDTSLGFVMSMVSALFADDRVPARYLDSIMGRLRNGCSVDQAALLFDGYGLNWSWKLDSESLSSVWLSSSDLDLLSLLPDSIPQDDWSMQPPTAGDWSAGRPTPDDWVTRPPASDADPTGDLSSVFPAENSHGISALPALRRPLSGFFPATEGCLQELGDQSHSPANGLWNFSGIFCDCCVGILDDHNSLTMKSWDHLETVDFFIDDNGAYLEPGYCLPVADGMNVCGKKSSAYGMESCKNSAGVVEASVYNDLLLGCSELTETLV